MIITGTYSGIIINENKSLNGLIMPLNLVDHKAIASPRYLLQWYLAQKMGVHAMSLP